MFGCLCAVFVFCVVWVVLTIFWMYQVSFHVFNICLWVVSPKLGFQLISGTALCFQRCGIKRVRSRWAMVRMWWVSGGSVSNCCKRQYSRTFNWTVLLLLCGLVCSQHRLFGVALCVCDVASGFWSHSVNAAAGAQVSLASVGLDQHMRLPKGGVMGGGAVVDFPWLRPWPAAGNWAAVVCM